jgi:hypothetical protein
MAYHLLSRARLSVLFMEESTAPFFAGPGVPGLTVVLSESLVTVESIEEPDWLVVSLHDVRIVMPRIAAIALMFIVIVLRYCPIMLPK